MKLLLILALSVSAGAQEYALKDVINTLVKVESDGNSKAIGDSGRAHGLLQIHPIMVKECNRLLNRNEFTLKDRFSPSRSKYMATVFLSHQISLYVNQCGKYPDELTLANSWNTGRIFSNQNLKYRNRYKTKKEI
jgi:hypothetical protein